MAINKKFIHFNYYDTFISRKLSANKQNTKYTIGVYGTKYEGEPEINYQTIVFIKDRNQIWTHGSIYECSSIFSELTWQELSNLKNNEELVPGHTYRITDYVTTVNSTGIISDDTGDFDIVVKALSNTELSEDVQLVARESSPNYTFYKNSGIEKWEVKYSLENDSSKYNWISDSRTNFYSGVVVCTTDSTYDASHGTVNQNPSSTKLLNWTINGLPSTTSNGNYWYFKVDGMYLWKAGSSNINDIFDNTKIWCISSNVDLIGSTGTYEGTGVDITYNTTNRGKGVIWYMKDNFGNECGYDFKHIKFLYDLTSDTTINNYIEDTLTILPEDNYYYTFSFIDKDGSISDASLNSYSPVTVQNNNLYTNYESNVLNNRRSIPVNIFITTRNIINTIKTRAEIIENTVHGNNNKFLFIEKFNRNCITSANNNISMCGNIVDNDIKSSFNNNILYNKTLIQNNIGYNFNNNKINEQIELEDCTFGNNICKLNIQGSGKMCLYNILSSAFTDITNVINVQFTTNTTQTNMYIIKNGSTYQLTTT